MNSAQINFKINVNVLSNVVKLISIIFLCANCAKSGLSVANQPSQGNPNNSSTPPTALSYSSNPVVYLESTLIADNKPSNAGGAISKYSILPSLPAGLTLNTLTGVISGTPTGPMPINYYTITGSNAAGSTSTDLLLTVAYKGITTFFSAGTTCNNPASANFTPGGAAVTISLCVTTLAPIKLCGMTFSLAPQFPNTENGRFEMSSRTLSPSFPDENQTFAPALIEFPTVRVDYGGTVNGAALSAQANRLVATFDITPQASATNPTYDLVLSSNSAFGIDSGDGFCQMPNDASVTASLRLIKQ